MRIDACWYRVVYAAPTADPWGAVRISYVYDIPDAGEDSIKTAIYRQIYHFSDSLLEKAFPIKIQSFTFVDRTYKVD